MQISTRMTYQYVLSFLCLLQCTLPVVGQQSPTDKYWIFFTNKNPTTLSLQKDLRKSFPERTIQRRLKNLSSDNLIDNYDLPVMPQYIDRVRSLGIEIMVESRWFNAVSANLSDEQKEIVSKLPFVSSVKVVARAKPNSITKSLVSSKNSSAFSNSDYGSSYEQNAIINTPAAHQLGYSGKGILIGMIDTGFNLKHIALRHVNVVDDSDFVENDKDVTEDTGVKGSSSHGTYVLSAIAGNAPGKLIGTAFGASYLLARTENDDGIGQKAEEDRWIAALEWLEKEGADIASSSISFFDDFQNAADNYTLSDLDGKTAMTTLATNIAFDKGLLVFNSAGNMGTRGSGYLGTPSDGKKMIAVGAIYGDSTVTTFSSRGPTKDGRKKPDLAALGYHVTVVGIDTSHYDFLDGTSLSTPLVAGLAALVLEANPSWNVKQLYEAIKKTASVSSKPNNQIGYGIPNAIKTLQYDPSGSSNPFVKNIMSFPNPSRGTVTISFQSLTTSRFSIKIYNTLGQFVSSIAENESANENEIVTRTWRGKNFNGNEVGSGVYFCRINLGGKSATEKIVIIK